MSAIISTSYFNVLPTAAGAVKRKKAPSRTIVLLVGCLGFYEHLMCQSEDAGLATTFPETASHFWLLVGHFDHDEN